MNNNLLIEDSKELSKRILNDMYPGYTFQDSNRRQKSIKDIEWLLLYIKEGLDSNNAKIVINLLEWMGPLFDGLKIDRSHISKLWTSTKKILNESFREKYLELFLEKIVYNPETTLAKFESHKYKNELDLYLDGLLTSNKKQSMKVVNDLLDQGTPIEDIYIYIFQDAMRQIGVLWQSGEIHVGREHYATAVTQFIMSTLYSVIFDNSFRDKKLLACAIGSELHELGIRMVADLFELKGWDTHYLGANLPSEEIVKHALEYRPNVIALSITMPYHISKLRQTIEEIRAEKDLSNIKIIVGGLPYIQNPELIKSVRADGVAYTALEGIEVANGMVE